MDLVVDENKVAITMADAGENLDEDIGLIASGWLDSFASPMGRFSSEFFQDVPVLPAEVKGIAKNVRNIKEKLEEKKVEDQKKGEGKQKDAGKKKGEGKNKGEGKKKDATKKLGENENKFEQLGENAEIGNTTGQSAASSGQVIVAHVGSMPRDKRQKQSPMFLWICFAIALKQVIFGLNP